MAIVAEQAARIGVDNGRDRPSVVNRGSGAMAANESLGWTKSKLADGKG